MSIIHDALKKAQQERKQDTPGVPFSLPEAKKKPRLALVGIVALLAAAVIAYLYIPAFHKQKTTAAAESRVAAPAAKAPAVVKSPAAEQQKPEPQKAQTAAGAVGTEPKTEVRQAPPAPAQGTAARGIRQPENADPVVASRPIPSEVRPLRTSKAGGQSARPSERQKAGGTKRQMVQEPQEEEPIRRTVTRKTEDQRITLRYNEALNLMNTGRSREAQKVFLEIIARRPDHVESLNNLGVISASRGNRKEALGYFEKILDVRADYPKAYNNIGLIMMSENDVRLAEEYFRKAISLDPDGLEPYMNLSALLRTQGRFQDAAMVLETPVKKNGRDPLLFLSYAVIKDNLGQTGDAVKYYRQYLSLSKSSDAQRNGVLERLRYLEGQGKK